MYDVDDDTRRVARRGGSAAPFGEVVAPATRSRGTGARHRGSLRHGSAGRRSGRARGLTIAVPRRVLRQLVLALVVLGASVVLIVAAFLREQPVETVRSVHYPGSPPAEWAGDALWRTPPLLPRSGPALVIGGDRVSVVTADRHVLMIDVASGNPVWAAPLPPGDTSTNLTETSIEGTRVVAVQVGDRLCWWSLDNGSPGQVALPAGSRSTFLGEQPLIGVGPSTVATVRGGALIRTEVPSGALALAARGNGTITAAAPVGWWHLSPAAAAERPHPWESISRDSIAPTVISYADGQIITALTGRTLAVLVYSDRDGDVRFNFGGVMQREAANSGQVTLSWSPSPSQDWGILSRTLIDLNRGNVVDLGNWSTKHVASDRALGTVSGRYALAGPSIQRSHLVDGEGFPEDLTSRGALVRARENDSETLYLLPPRIP